MARNEEKANAALNRWVTMKTAERLGFHDKRPLRMTEVTSIVEAEKWRGEVLREISQKASQIQNGLLLLFLLRERKKERLSHNDQQRSLENNESVT